MRQKTPTLDDIIAELEHFRARIAMYIHPVDIANTRSFLNGVELGLALFGVMFHREHWWQVQENRGWSRSAAGPVSQMEDKGMTTQQIIHELVDIEIETLRRSWAIA